MPGRPGDAAPRRRRAAYDVVAGQPASRDQAQRHAAPWCFSARAHARRVFGFGAEIGISTQKLHARGPMGLPEMTSTKYVVTGDGHVR